ncbi:hypothetical protein [Microbulbifer guangxiensis]|uniref:hypothetical protein n=1 Tax=Microbulbifer guangxiensis TaxID=2904249 RepID=UPI001F25E10F|nr:hypothetical protein [Microbulbifer guangxiensis]
MKDEQKPGREKANPEPAAQRRGRHSYAEADQPSPGKSDGESAEQEASTLARAEAALTLVTHWTGNLQTLMRLEFERTLAAGKRIVALSLVLLPLAITFLLSTCAGLGLLAYYFSQSIYIGFMAFFLAQLAILVVILLYQNRLRSLLGFTQTREQVMEAIDDVRQTFK